MQVSDQPLEKNDANVFKFLKAIELFASYHKSKKSILFSHDIFLSYMYISLFTD